MDKTAAKVVLHQVLSSGARTCASKHKHTHTPLKRHSKPAYCTNCLINLTFLIARFQCIGYECSFTSLLQAAVSLTVVFCPETVSVSSTAAVDEGPACSRARVEVPEQHVLGAVALRHRLKTDFWGRRCTGGQKYMIFLGVFCTGQ